MIGAIHLLPTYWSYTSPSHILELYISFPHIGAIHLLPTYWSYTSPSHVLELYISFPYVGTIHLLPIYWSYTFPSHICLYGVHGEHFADVMNGKQTAE
jgi:hypothetical protein